MKNDKMQNESNMDKAVTAWLKSNKGTYGPISYVADHLVKTCNVSQKTAMRFVRDHMSS